MGSTNVSPKLRALQPLQLRNNGADCFNTEARRHKGTELFMAAFGRRGLGESPALGHSMQRLTVEWAKRAAAVAEANLSTIGVDPKQGKETNNETT